MENNKVESNQSVEISKNKEGQSIIEKRPYDVIGYTSYIIAVVFIGLGFYKMFSYQESYTIAFFILATAFIILGSIMLIIQILKDNIKIAK